MPYLSTPTPKYPHNPTHTPPKTFLTPPKRYTSLYPTPLVNSIPQFPIKHHDSLQNNSKKKLIWIFIIIIKKNSKTIKVLMQGGNKKVAMLHIKKQFQLAQKCEADLSMSVGLVEDQLFNWRVCFQGPESTPFEGGLYQAILKFPDDFPYQPPKMTFTTEMFHPNIYPNGQVCISILHPPVEDPLNPQQKLSEKWNPILTIEAVLVSVTSMLVDPNLDSPANVDAAKMFKESKKEYDKKLRYLARKSIGDI